MLKDNLMEQVKKGHPVRRTESPIVNQGKTAVMWTVQSWGLALLTLLSFFPFAFNVEEHLFFAFLLLALGTAWIEGKSMWVPTPIDLPLLLFVGWVLLSIPFAVDPAYSFGEWRKLISSVLVFYWVMLVLRKNENQKVFSIFLGTVVLGVVVQCGYSLIEFVVQGGSWKHRIIRATAPFSGFQELTTYMVMVIPLLIVTIMVSVKWWQRLISYGAVGLALAAQVFTYTRAGWLGMLAQGIGFGIFTKRHAIRLALFISLACACLGLFFIFQMGYHKSTFDPLTLNSRLEVWELGVQEMLKQPIFGLGFGINTFEPWIDDMPHGGGRIHLHNTFLMVGVGSGWPALILFIWVLVNAIQSLLNQASKMTDSLRFGIMVGAALMVLGFTVRNLFDYMFKGSLAYLFWIILAVGLANCMKISKPAKD
jgi:heptosyltransferase-3/putative inorganic carbon (HCO3(-)) transporter